MDITKINDFKEYFEFLSQNKKNYIILICSRSNIGSNISDAQADLIHSVGIKTDLSTKRGLKDKYRRGYFAVVDGGEIVAEELGVDKKTLRYRDEKFSIKSTVRASGKSAKSANIMVDAEEYCVNKKGLNIVVIDKKSNLPIDSINFHLSSDTCELKRRSTRKLIENNILSEFDKVRRITSGLSTAKKYCVDQGEEKFFLRIYNISKFSRKAYEIEIMKQLAEIGVPIAKPIDFGKKGKVVYYTTELLKGKNLSHWIKELSTTEEYDLGIKAGKALKLMHKLPADSNEECWSVKYMERFNNIILQCEEEEINFHKLDVVRDYFNKHRHLINDRPQNFVHNDFGVHNMMLYKQNLTFFDFDTLDFGDPWSDFMQIIPRKDKKKLEQNDVTSFFATGCINGYFSDENGAVKLPEGFWELYTLYTIVRRLRSAVIFMECKKSSQIKAKELEKFYSASSDMTVVIPRWYINTMEKLSGMLSV